MGTLVVIHSTSHEDPLLSLSSPPPWPWPLPMAPTSPTAPDRTIPSMSAHTPSTSSPIQSKKDAEVMIHFNADVVKAFPQGTTLDFKMVKEGIPLPCMAVGDLPFKVGSCTYEAQTLLDVVPDELWKKFAPAGQAKALPLNPGNYGDFDENGNIKLTIPDIPEIIKPLIKGDITVTVNFNINGANILCADDTLHVVTA